MAILVVGGSGFIGSEVVKFLALNNVDAISCDLINTSLTDSKNNWVKADILESQALEKVFFDYQVDSVIHLVGLPTIEYCQKNPGFSFQLNVLSVQKTLEAMRIADVSKIVFASSAAVYGLSSEKPVKEEDSTKPNSIYGHHKLLAEEVIQSYVEAYGIRGVILRLFNVYGGDPRIGKEVISLFLRKASKGEEITVRGPDKFRDFVHIDDVTRSFSEAVTRKDVGHATLNVGTGTKTTLKDVSSIITLNFPRVRVVEEASPDNGTGIIANVDQAERLLGFACRDPVDGIGAHVRRYREMVEKVSQQGRVSSGARKDDP
jgi:UDP-glucose 4-epimerase